VASRMILRVLGSGDPFGSGGRNPSSYLVEAGGRRILLDCGAGAVVSLKKAAVDTASLDLVLLSHFHADHVAGVPFLYHDYQRATLRRSPLLVAGPPGVRRRVETIYRALFPTPARRRFRVIYRSLRPDRSFRPREVPGLRVAPFRVRHRTGASDFGYRIEMAGRRLVYSGDTGWFDGLARAARGADLFLCECTHRDGESPGHLSLEQLLARRRALGARRILLTHLGPSLVRRRGAPGFALARDGMMVRV
jgi:ribonuclease BN (tRNA processing enzyme)